MLGENLELVCLKTASLTVVSREAVALSCRVIALSTARTVSSPGVSVSSKDIIARWALDKAAVVSSTSKIALASPKHILRPSVVGEGELRGERRLAYPDTVVAAMICGCFIHTLASATRESWLADALAGGAIAISDVRALGVVVRAVLVVGLRYPGLTVRASILRAVSSGELWLAIRARVTFTSVLGTADTVVVASIRAVSLRKRCADEKQTGYGQGLRHHGCE